MADDIVQQRVVGRVVVVVGVVMVVVVVPGAVVDVVPRVVVVVVDPGHPLGPHASQQLGTWPTHALPPAGARHEREFLRMSQ